MTGVAALTLAAAVHASPTPVDPHARVRPMVPRAERLLADGMAQSPTFRALVHRIEQSDIIVYIDIRMDMRSGLGGSTWFLARSATDRFVRVQINGLHLLPVQVALLGHELQHVVEIAEHGDVESADALREFYRATGVRTGPDSFDSLAARQTGYTVRAELLTFRRGFDLRLARNAAEDRLLEGASITTRDDGAETSSGSARY
jgi:hypothetical protein